ncbi:pyridoxal-phosphate dependent enzyme [Mesoterricola silvestris]|uniref:Pyridoxal-5'-phosphate-dependent protein subunit beta n=1 Tax=Mesoterricola silvestris TaxID=2927979 RepID=A0AA48GP37_9BACT|nr:pyridoxal-phosphate dependent enzyme [Mesoterricola silvestris]BDU74934.1 pyridoxal-5'-phosphate-dependent protein subunit beta [Mesoterricola silvestris]
MSRIVKTYNEEVVKRTAKRCKDRGIVIPTFHQMRHPETAPDAVKARLKNVGLWDVDPANLFRITWKNDPATGLFGGPNHLEIPREITGVKARIIGLVGKYFPTGAHKVGAAFACLVPRLVSGEFDPDTHKAVWPSTGNYCRGGAFDSAVLGCTAIAILPENMSQERFTWLAQIGSEVIATPGCESNVKEIYDKCWELKNDPKHVIFNQFEEFGNPVWHYNVTGPAIEDVFNAIKTPSTRLAAYASATGSAGTIAAGDYLKAHHPGAKVIATEAWQCPTLLMNGFGDHRIEGIGDKHVPWVHNVRNTDAVAAIDDEDCMRILRLFNEPEGQKHLAGLGISQDVIQKLGLLGISGICNLLAAIKAAKYWELDENDVVFTIFTDSVEMYRSRLDEQTAEHGAFTAVDAATTRVGSLERQGVDHFKELTYPEKKAIHNLKYYTWVEQQGKTYEEICAQWDPEYWRQLFTEEAAAFDKLIEKFNQEVARS